MWMAGAVLVLLFPLVCSAWAAEAPGPKTLKLGVRSDCPPFSYYDKFSRTYRGYSVDLCLEIARNAMAFSDYQAYEIKEVTAQDRFQKLDKKDIDLLCEATTVTQERLRVFGSTLYTFVSGASLMYSPNAVSEDELVVGVLPGTTTEKAVRTILRRQTDIVRDNIHDFGRYKSESCPDYHWKSLDLFRNKKISVYIADREILLALSQRASEENQKLDREKIKKAQEKTEGDQEQQKKDREDLASAEKEQEGSRIPRLMVSKNYYTIEPYALFTRRDDHQLSYLANRTLAEIFKDDIDKIFHNNFPNKRMSESLRQLFRLQQLLRGGDPLKDPCPDPIDPQQENTDQ
jgi:ABC-type amino acid transport substrate-binding protein